MDIYMGKTGIHIYIHTYIYTYTHNTHTYTHPYIIHIYTLREIHSLYVSVSVYIHWVYT